MLFPNSSEMQYAALGEFRIIQTRLPKIFFPVVNTGIVHWRRSLGEGRVSGKIKVGRQESFRRQFQKPDAFVIALT